MLIPIQQTRHIYLYADFQLDRIFSSLFNRDMVDSGAGFFRGVCFARIF